MPTYEYHCEICKADFTMIMSISEHARGKVSCPQCKGRKVFQRLSTFVPSTGTGTVRKGISG